MIFHCKKKRLQNFNIYHKNCSLYARGQRLYSYRGMTRLSSMEPRIRNFHVRKATRLVQIYYIKSKHFHGGERHPPGAIPAKDLFAVGCETILS